MADLTPNIVSQHVYEEPNWRDVRVSVTEVVLQGTADTITIPAGSATNYCKALGTAGTIALSGTGNITATFTSGVAGERVFIVARHTGFING